MTERENVLRAARFERPETIPARFHINAACWHHYPQSALQELMAAHPALFPNVESTSQPPEIDHSPDALAGRPYTDPWGCVYESPDDGIIGVATKHPLENWELFESFTPPDPDEVLGRLPIDWDDVARKGGSCDVALGLRDGSLDHGHTFLRLCDLRGYQNLLCDIAADEPRLQRLIEMVEQFNLGVVRNFLERVGVEWMAYPEDLGMQQGPMLSPAHFRKFIKPIYKRLIRPAKEAGCIIHMHSDGDIRTLVADLLDCGLDVINLQDLVNGIDWIRHNLAHKVCVEVDVDRQKVTVHGTPAKVDAHIRKIVENLGSREGGLMMVYGLYPGTPVRNAVAVAEAMDKYRGHYS